MLKLKNVSKYYYQDGVIATGFTKVNLELFMGEFVVITGESGSGKSTLLNVLSGLDTYEDGEMYINGEETSHYTEEDYLEYRRKYVSNIFQNFNLVNSYTVYENIELAMLMNGKNRRNVKKYINELIEKVGLTKYRNTKTSKLSGGQKQRVAIARALANDTPIIVADEPTGALDSKSSSSILKLLKEISKDKLVVVVTHNKKEIEGFATRLIKMHDGRILENIVVEKINLDNELVEQDVKDITLISKIRLSIKNAFNIPVKFILMFIIFLLISITLMTNYASFKMAENEESMTAYNNYFLDASDKRIVLSKNDKTIFNERDYDKIKSLDNIDYLVENDLLNDYSLYMNNEYTYLDGRVYLKELNNVDIGRLIQKDNEVVLIGNKENWYIENESENILNKEFVINDESDKKVTVVGIKYDDNIDDYTFNFYFSNNLLNDIKLNLSKRFLNTEVLINNNYFNDQTNPIIVYASDKVPAGEVFINESLNAYCKYNWCINKLLNIKVNNIYYVDNKDFKITKLYNKNNIKNLLSKSYNEYEIEIFINTDDYNNLYNKGNYQSSVYVKEIKELSNTIKDLDKLGFNTLSLRDSKKDEAATIMQIFKIFRLVVTIILIIVLFFITYFVIKIIYKSRNSYYTTLRTLGSTKKVCINILRRELIVLATFTYLLFMIFMYLIYKGIINYEYFNELIKYIGINDYIIVYLILIVLSILISYRYGRKIFKDSIIKTYGERI